MNTTETKLLSHQLQGIMECWDMTNLFYLLKMPQLYKQQKYRLFKLMECHQWTNTTMIQQYGEIDEIPYEYSSHLKLPLKQDMESSERTTLINEMLDSWLKWSTTLMELCTQLYQDNKIVWKRLCVHSQNEVHMAQRMHDMYYTQPKTKNLRMELQAKLNAAKNASI